MAREGEASIAALKAKHPDSFPDTKLPQPPLEEASGAALVVSDPDVAWVIQTFPKGSAGGPDGLRPQQHDKHLNRCRKPYAPMGAYSLHQLCAHRSSLVLPSHC